MAMTEKPALPHKWLNKAWLIAPRCRRRRNEHAQTTMLETSPTPSAPFAAPKYRPGTATRAHMVVIIGRLLEVARAPDLRVTCRPAARRSNRRAAISISHEVREPRHARLELEDHLAGGAMALLGDDQLGQAEHALHVSRPLRVILEDLGAVALG